MQSIVKFLVFSSLVFFQVASEAHPRDQMYRDYLRQKFLRDQNVSGMVLDLPLATEATFDQTLNPEQKPDGTRDPRTFKQRYFIDSSLAASKESPVFLSLCGEWTCSASELEWMRENARFYHAHLISLEHRYYGKSQPFTTLSVVNLQYLKTEYAVSDIARFQTFAMKTLGLTGKWVVTGGSYSANLAAYYRAAFPELVTGALASSAPVEAHANFEEYDLHVNNVVSPRCSAGLRSVVKTIDAAIGNPTEMLRIKTIFNAQDIKDDKDFFMVMGDMSGGAVQYGFHQEFCDEFLAGAPDLLSSFAKVGMKSLAKVGLTPLGDSYQVSESENDFTGARAWTYQSCTEFGYWQTAYHDPQKATRSQKVDLLYFNDVCKRLFGINQPVNTNVINDLYYKFLTGAQASNIMFTNGSSDPWSVLSISNERGNAASKGLTLYTVEGGSHTQDLYPLNPVGDSPSLQGARTGFADLLKAWLN